MFHQNLMLRKSKSPVIYWITGLCIWGARTDSNRRHSEPQSDALTN